jgi:hypothetical protein
VSATPFGLRVVFYILILVALVCCWAFVIMYTKTWPWWRNDVGRYTVSFSACLGMFMLYYAVRILWPQMPGAPWIALVLFVLLDVVITWQLVLFIRIRREQRRLREREVDRGKDVRR